jgi:hypothetical protein
MNRREEERKGRDGGWGMGEESGEGEGGRRGEEVWEEREEGCER